MISTFNTMPSVNDDHKNNQEKAGPPHDDTEEQTGEELVILSVATQWIKHLEMLRFDYLMIHKEIAGIN